MTQTIEIPTASSVFIPCKSRSTAKRQAPWADTIAKAGGGYIAFKTHDDYRAWRDQDKIPKVAPSYTHWSTTSEDTEYVCEKIGFIFHINFVKTRRTKYGEFLVSATAGKIDEFRALIRECDAHGFTVDPKFRRAVRNF